MIHAQTTAVTMLGCVVHFVCASSYDSYSTVSPSNTPVAATEGIEPKLPAMGSDPLSVSVKCTDYSHHWTSIAFYAGMKSQLECVDMDSGQQFKVQQMCHGGGLSLGIYNYMEGYKSFRDVDALRELEGGHDMMCTGLSATFGWSFLGPFEYCMMRKNGDGKTLGEYHPTWRGG